MQVINVDIKDLKPHKRNAKKHSDEQINHIAKSIQDFGFNQPLVIDKNNVVVVGHGRLLAAQKLNMDKVPCVVKDDLTPDKIRAYRLADNKTNESPWDFELLELELKDICDIDMSEFGFLEMRNIDIDYFFYAPENTDEESDKKQIQCPHCKMYFEQ